MPAAIIDTGVYVDYWERGAYQETRETVRRGYIVRHSAIVLSELRRGARSRESIQRTSYMSTNFTIASMYC